MEEKYQEIDGWMIPKEEVEAYLKDLQALKSTLYRYAMTYYDRFYDRGRDTDEGHHIYAERKEDGLEFMMPLNPHTVSHFRLWKDDLDGYLEILHWHQLQYLNMAYEGVSRDEDILAFLSNQFEKDFDKAYEGRYCF